MDNDIPPRLEQIPYINQPVPKILTAGQPTEDQFRALPEAGYKTVVDLRADGEPGTWDEESLANEIGIDYIKLPIRGPQNLTPQNVQRLDDAIEDAPGGVFIHCASSNRVGALLALRAGWLEETPTHEAMKLGKRGGMTSLEDTIQRLLENPI